MHTRRAPGARLPCSDAQRRRWESLFSPEAGRAAVAELLDDLSL